MADDAQSLLEQAQAIQARKTGQSDASDGNDDLLKQAQAIQQSKMASNPISEEPTEEPPSSLEAFSRGGLRGLTAGLSGLSTTERAAAEKSKEAHPYLYTAGEVAGSIPLMAAGGAGLAGLGITGLKAAGTLGAAQGLGTYLGENEKPDVSGALKATAIGGGLGLVGGKITEGIGNSLNPEARKLGQQGKSLIDKYARNNLAKETEQLANNIVNSIQSEKGRVGQAYEAILDANSSKKIDLTDFVAKLKDRATNLDTSLPEQARDKKAIMDLITKVTEGPETEKSIITGFKPGKTIEEIPSSQEQLQNEAKNFIESQKQLGKSATSSIVPSDDDSLLTHILRTENENGPSVTARTVQNTPGSPAYSTIKPNIEKQLVREGGTLTPNITEAKTLRTNLGKFANEKNLSTTGEQFADQTYSDLSNILKEQIPGLAPTDSQYSSLLKAGRKLGIKGNDEDVVAVLQKITSNNQGKQIIVDQALSQLDNVNPQLSNQIRNNATNIDQKAEMLDKISSIGNYNILNPKSVVLGLIKDFGALRVAGGNIVGLAEKKAVETPAGKIIQKSITSIPMATVTNPFTQGRVQKVISKEGITGSEASADDFTEIPRQGTSEASKIATNLYSADDDSLKNIASSFSKTPGLEFYGEALNKAVDGKDTDAKNRAVFLIMQHPKARKLVTPVKDVEKHTKKALEESEDR